MGKSSARLCGYRLIKIAIYDADSPLTYIKNAKAPLLVLQGDNDIRVPREEAEQVVKTLRDAGKTVDARYYANEGHGFTKRENQLTPERAPSAALARFARSDSAL
jgi:dipeptidyl aminopeptidase/acylaminoacyl peptidase